MELLLKDALLMSHDRMWLADTARSFGLTPEADPVLTAEKLAGIMLDPENLFGRMLVLNDNDISFFEYVIRNKTVHPASANYRSADRLRHLDLAAIVNAKRDLAVPDDLAAVYQSFDLNAFHGLRRKVSWLFDCVSLIPNFYGFLAIHDLCDMYRRKKGMDDDNAAIVMRLLPYVIHHPDCLCIREGNEIITIGLNDAGNEAKLRELHESIPLVIPSYSEIKDILDHRYPSRNPAYAKLNRYLIRQLNQSEYYAEALMEAIFRYIGYGNTFDDIMEMFAAEQIEVSPEQRQDLKNLMADAWDTTRMLMCNGHRPCDVMPGNRQIFLNEED